MVRKPALILLLPVIASTFEARKSILAAGPCLAAFALVTGWWPATGPQFTITASSCLPATGDRFGLRTPLLVFGWETIPRVGMPVKARKEIGEEYSAARGFWAICRKTQAIWFACGQTIERVKARTTPESARKLFLEYVRVIETLQKRRPWCNALTGNCITDIAGTIDPKTRWGDFFSRRSSQTCSGT